MRNRLGRFWLPRVAPSLLLQRRWPGPMMVVPVVSWHRSHLEPGAIALVGMRHMGSWQVPSPLAMTGAQALRMAWYAVPYLARIGLDELGGGDACCAS